MRNRCDSAAALIVYTLVQLYTACTISPPARPVEFNMYLAGKSV